MRAKNLNGIVGPVAEVFEVPKKLAKAVETALGASLQNIVVHDVSDAKAAIRYTFDSKQARACNFFAANNCQTTFSKRQSGSSRSKR